MTKLREAFMSDGTTIRYSDEGEGPCIIALHGFPDTRNTWCSLSEALCSRSYRVVVPALRGYVPSSIPANGDYSLFRLANDVRELMDQLGIERATIIGHDWGASAAYAFSALWPDRALAIVTFAIPPLAVFPTGPGEWWTRPHNLYLRLGLLSAWWLRLGRMREVRRLYGLWSPSWLPPSGHIEHVINSLYQPERSRAAVDYYGSDAPPKGTPTIAKPISVPALIVYGSDEPQIRKAAFAKALAVVGSGSRTVMFEGAGHWPHLEQIDRSLEEILAFFDRHDVRCDAQKSSG